MSARQALVALLVLTLAIPAACSNPPPPPSIAPAPQPPSATPDADAATPDSGVADTEPPTASTAEPIADAGPLPFEDKTIACGSRLCHVDREACCGRGDETAACAPRVVKQTASDFAELDPQTQACNGAMPTFCDDSSDCAAGEHCCVGSDPDVTHCQKRPCTTIEVCVPERPCRTAGTTCVAGICRRADVHIPCGTQVCTGATPVCCQDPARGTQACATDCPRGSSFVCAKASDCPAGQICQAYGERSWCTRVADIANAHILCASDTDCPKDVCAFSHGKGRPRCPKGTGVRSCECR